MILCVRYWCLICLFPVPIANGSTIDVWIQGEKYAGGYIFHDGSSFPTDFGTGTFCPVQLNPDPNEIRFRAHGSSTFDCRDRAQHHLYSFLCEYYRRFTIWNKQCTCTQYPPGVTLNGKTKKTPKKQKQITSELRVYIFCLCALGMCHSFVQVQWLWIIKKIYIHY